MTLKLLSCPQGRVNSIFTSTGNNVTTAQRRLLILRAPVYVIVFLYLFNFMKKKRNFEVWFLCNFILSAVTLFNVNLSLPLPAVYVCVHARVLHACHCVYTCVHVHSHGAQIRMLGVILYCVLPYFLKRGSHWVRSLLFFAGLLASKFSRPFCLCSLMVSLQMCIAMSYFFKKMNYCKNPFLKVYVIKFCWKYFVSKIKRSCM